MKVDLLILQLAVIFLPGIIWARLDASYAAKVKPSDSQFFLRAFIFGIAIYTVEFILFAALGWPFTMADLADAGTKGIVTKDILHEVLWGLGIGLVLSVLWLYLSNYKALTWLLQKIGATKKYGDEDVWDHTFNSRDAVVEYVHVRDFANQYVYAGWVNTFSETDKLRELVLLDVIVYNFDSEELYRIPRLYLARPPENIHIEFPYGKPDAEEDPDK
jgi:hypothetical protein